MESILQIYQLAMVVLPVYGFVSLRKRLHYGSLSKTQAMLRYAGMVFAPILVYATVNMLAVGVENVLRVSLVSEEIARSLLLVIALGLAVWILAAIVFAVGLCFVRKVAVATISNQMSTSDTNRTNGK